MITYTATLSIDQATRDFLKSKGYTLYVFKGINAGSGATSTVWITISGNQLYDQSSNIITWYEDYYVGEESTEIENGASISGTNPYISPNNITSVSLGQNYIWPGSSWNPQAGNQPTETAFTIQNNEPVINNFYVSQKVEGGPTDYIVVTEIAGSGGVGQFTPIETFAMILSTQSQSTGTMITEAFSPGVIVTMTGITSAALSYDSGTGWNVTAGQSTPLQLGDAVYDSMMNAAETSAATEGRYPGAPFVTNLADGKKTTSNGKVSGVRLVGMQGVNYSTQTNVTVQCNGKYSYNKMTDQTNVSVDLGQGTYSVSNNSGGTIQYAWE